MSSKKNLVIWIIVALACGAISGYVVKPETDTTNLENQISSLENQVTNLSQQGITKDDQILNLETEILILEELLELEVLGIYISPKGGCENQTLQLISKANTSIYILIYSFTLDSIGDALVDAHLRGVEIRAVFEKSQISQYSEYQKLKAAGIAVQNDTNSRSMHNKIMIVDGTIVTTGSFNWSNNGENYNDENLILINSTYVADIYLEEFARIWEKSYY